MKKYCYLIQRKNDGKKFVAYGNTKIPSEGISYLFDFANENYPYPISTAYGDRKNVSNGAHFDGRYYSIIHQTAI